MKIRVLLGAWLLAIASGTAFALGLGEIIVNSRLNQPLDAEILVREAVPGEAEQLVAKLASQEDFARVGLERSRMPVLLRFEAGKNARGQTVIKVTSDDPVREPFLTLLVEANWSGGRLLREYGLLLDPPVTAPASTIARTAPPRAAPVQPAEPASPPVAPTPPPAQTVPLAAEQSATAVPPPPPATPPPPARVEPAPAPRASAPPPGFAPPAQPATRPAAPPAAPAAPSPAPAVAAAPGSYTVQRGDTLYGIAREFAADAGVTADQMMVALQRDNASAFFADNINNLKAGAVLRIPDTDTARGLARSDAAAEVRRQNDNWKSASTAPALADAGAAPSRTVSAEPAAVADARLELVPPRTGSAGDNASAGRAGNGEGGSDVAEAQVELQRTREDLRSRDQEVSELGSRVRDLEELNAKNARLLELKNTEVAELQRRLAETMASADASSDTQAVAEQGAVDPALPDADTPEIAGESPAGETTPSSGPADGTTVAVDDAQEPVTDTTESSPDAADAIAAVGNDDAAVDATAADATAADATDSSATGADLSEAEWEASATASDSDPFAESADPLPTTGDTWAPGEPESDTTAAPATLAQADAPATAAVAAATPVEPAATQPWYMQPMVQGAGLIGLALLLLLVLLARRQRKTDTDPEAPKRSVSDLFVETGAVGATGIGGAATVAPVLDDNDDASALQAQIGNDPDDFGAYLELLSLYYAEGDRDRFQLWAERFHDRDGSEESIEWEQVESMGEELLPDHPLFSDGDDADDAFEVDDVTVPGGDADVARSSWNDEPTPSSAFDADDAGVTTPQPAAPESDPASLDADQTRRVYDVGGTDFMLDVGNDDTAADDDSNPIEFSLDDLDTPEPVRPAPVSNTVDSDADAGDDTLAPLAFDGDDAPAPIHRDEPSVDRGFETIDVDGGTDRDDDGGLDDAATKLELARAYLDMGDPEGARAMLEEVLGEGDTSQRDEARKLLATL